MDLETSYSMFSARLTILYGNFSILGLSLRGDSDYPLSKSVCYYCYYYSLGSPDFLSIRLVFVAGISGIILFPVVFFFLGGGGDGAKN